MDFLSMISAANFASAYETRSWGDYLLVDCPARNMRSVVGVRLRYLISLLRAFQCLCVGLLDATASRFATK